MIPPTPPGNLAVCPYCGSPTEIREASVVYGTCDFGKLLICSAFPECDSFVGVHKGTDIPKGTLADRELREWRKRAHMMFDPLWKTGRMSRGQAYRRLAGLIGIRPDAAHIAWFTVSQCQRTIAALTAAKEVHA